MVKKYSEETIIRHLKFIDVVRTMSDGVIVVNDKRKIIYASSNADTIFGYKTGELIDKSHDVLVPKRSTEKHVNHCTQYFLKPKTLPIGGIHKDLIGVRKDGSEFNIDVGISCVNTEKGLLAISIVRDITEQRITQRSLKNSKDYLEKLNNAIQDGVFTVKLPERKIEYINNSVEKIFGYSRKELVGQSAEIIYPDKRDFVKFGEKIKKFIETGNEVLQTEQLLKRKDGQIFTGDITLTFAKEKDKSLAIYVIKDITTSKKAEMELLKSEKRFRSTLDNMMEGCQIVGFDWRYLFVNDAVVQQGHKSKEDLLGRTMMEVYPGIENTELFSHLHRCMDERSSHRFDNLFTFTDGTEGWFELSVQPVPEGVFILSIDITERMKYQEALETNKKELLSQVRITADFLNILEKSATSLNFHESLNKILQPLNSLLGCKNCFVYCLNTKKQKLQPSHQWKLSKESLAYFMSSNIDLKKNKELGSNSDLQFKNSADLMPRLPFNIQKLLDNMNSKSLIIIPITYEDVIQSLIICSFGAKKIFSKKEKDIANNLQKHLESLFMSYGHSTSLQNKTMDFTRQLQLAEAMRSIDRSVLTSSNEEEIIYGSIKLFGKVIPSEITEVLKFNPVKQEYYSIASYENERIYISSGKSFKTKEIKSKTSIVFGLPDYYPDLSEINVPGNYEKYYRDKGYKSLLVIPLISKGEPKGLLAMASNKAALYSPEHLSIAQSLGNQIAVALSNTGLISDLQDMLVGVINSLATALDAKSDWTQGHSKRVGNIAQRIGEHLRLSDEELYDLRLSALFHDVGKIGTYDIVLDKPGKLSDEEFALIRKHPVKTYEILAAIPRLENIGNIAKSHHEKYDGSGYPDGLTGDEIPLLSRIISIADSFDAMISDRPYRKHFDLDVIIDEFQSQSGKQFDPEITDVFIEILKKEQDSIVKQQKAA